MFEIIDSGRHKSALSGDLTPLSIDIENKCGKFVGSEGYIYDTSLEHCTCADFAIHGVFNRYAKDIRNFKNLFFSWRTFMNELKLF